MIRVDRAFFQAGLACLDSGRSTIGFVFLNHFLDLVDAIEEGQLEVDHADLDGTDIPFQVPLPQTVFCVADQKHAYRFTGQPLSEQAARKMEIIAGNQQADASAFSGATLVEQVRGWILQKSMDAGEQAFQLPISGNSTFESNLESADGVRQLPCLVTGYPVLPDQLLELKAGRWAANKDDWNKLLMVTKVWSKLLINPD